MKRLRNLTLFFIGTMTLGLSLAFGYLCWMQANQFVNIPVTVTTLTPADFGIESYEDITLATSDGLQLRGWYIAPTRDDGATFIFLHGHGGTIVDLMPEAQLYIGMGYGALLFEMRGHGMSDDAPITMGINEVRDVQVAYDFLLTQDTVNPERIALYGNSMGASTAILSAAQLPDIRVVIADAPYSSIRDTLVDGIPQQTGIPALFFPDVIIGMSSFLSGANYYDASPITAIQNVTQPILILHGTLDERISYHQSEALYAVANAPKVLHIVEGGGHVNNYEYDVAGYKAVVFPFLEQYFTN